MNRPEQTNSPAQLENLAEIYSLIVSIDHVEKAYIRDTITADDYNEVMPRLLSQYYKVVETPLVESVFDNLDAFIAQYKVDATTGVQRIKVGIPATAEASSMPVRAGTTSDKENINNRSNGRSGKAVAHVAGHFITFSDGIHLGYRRKDELHPLLADLATSLNKVTKENFEGRGKIVEWLIRLNQLRIGEALTEEEAQRCLEDVQAGYNSFLALLD